jgi:hypothetical protein
MRCLLVLALLLVPVSARAANPSVEAGYIMRRCVAEDPICGAYLKGVFDALRERRSKIAPPFARREIETSTAHSCVAGS